MEKPALRQILDIELNDSNGVELQVSPMSSENDKRRLQIEWLKANWNEYAGQYVALDGNELVGHGATIREATEQARANNVKNAFVVRVFAEDSIVSAGL